MLSFLRRGSAGVMGARLESPRANYATPAAPSGTTRAPRQRQLPTNHGHADRPLGVTRAYQLERLIHLRHVTPPGSMRGRCWSIFPKLSWSSTSGSGQRRPAESLPPVARGAPGHLPAEALAPWHPSWPSGGQAPPGVPGRVRVPLQSAQVVPRGDALLPPCPAGGPDPSRLLPRPHQASASPQQVGVT